jgi:hypothetical protein
VGDDIGGTIARSVAAQTEAHKGLTSSFTINIREDVTDYNNKNNGIYLNNAAYNRFTAEYKKANAVRNDLGKKAENIMWLVRDQGRGIAVRPPYSSAEGAALTAVADRYRLKLLPGETATGFPKMTISASGNGSYDAVINLANSWEDQRNADAVTALLGQIQKLEPDQEDLTGVYKIHSDAKTHALSVTLQEKNALLPEEEAPQTTAPGPGAVAKPDQLKP